MTNHEPDPNPTPKQVAKEAEHRRLDDGIDEQSRESFPASDPPSFTPVTGTGSPATTDAVDEKPER